MKRSPTYQEIAENFRLWSEYADQLGLDSEESFNQQSVTEKILILEKCFGPEDLGYDEDLDKPMIAVSLTFNRNCV